MLIQKIIKFTAGLTIFFYLATGAGFAQPVAPSVVLPSASPELFGNLEKIQIPEGLGEIQKVHLAAKQETRDRRQATGDKRQGEHAARLVSRSPFIIFIQDAHAVVDAQNHIQEIIRHLQQTYGIRVIALEGAAGEIDPTLLRTFPDSFIKQGVLTDYLKRGELTGAEMAAALNPSAGAYYGIEDWNLYQEHYLAYLRAVEKKETVLKSLTGTRKALDAKRAKVYSAKFNEFHEKLRAFENESYLLELLTYLASLEGTKQKLSQYPDLEKLYRSFEFEKETEEKGSIESSIRQMADRFKAKHVKQMNIKQEMTFHRNYQLLVTGQMEAGMFLKYLVETGESFGVKARLTPVMLKILGYNETLGTIKGTKLFDELEEFIREIEDTLIATPEEREIADKYRRLTLLKDLVKLELTRNQLDEYQNAPEAYLSTLTPTLSLPGRGQGEGAELLVFALEFYRLAVERDKAFHLNLKKLLKTQKADAAIVVAGGFHTEGFERNLKEEGYSYTVITPKIQSLEGQETYAEVMQGKLSYVPQFKTTFYDAFIKHSTAKLMNEFNETDFRKNIKLWRDEIIRKLSNEGRIVEASEYLRHLDLLLNVYNEKFESGTRVAKSKEEILKAVENELTQFKKETLSDLWRRLDFQIKEFSAGLKSLVARKELSAQNISSLLDHVGQVKPSTLGAPLSLAKIGFDSPDLISWKNRTASYVVRAEVRQPIIPEKKERKKSVAFDLEKTVEHIVRLFQEDETRKVLPTQKELSKALGPSQMTFSNRFDEIVEELTIRISERGFNPELRKRIRDAIEPIPERKAQRAKAQRHSVAFDLEKTVEHIVGLFQEDETRKALPTQTELSSALGPHQGTFSNHFDEIVEELTIRISERGFNPELRKRIKETIESPERIVFDLDKTVEYIIRLFQEDETRQALPTQTELSSALGPHHGTFSNHFDEIVEELTIRISERGFNPELRKRIKDAMGKAFDLEKTIEHIIGLFEQDESRKVFPTQVKLSEALGPSHKTFTRHFDEIVEGLAAKINEHGFDSELRKRIRDAIEPIPERKAQRAKAQRHFVAFDLEKTVEYIVGLFQEDETRKALPTQTELSSALGPHQGTFSNHFDEIVEELTAKISERGFDPELRKRINEATERRHSVAFDLDQTMEHIIGLFEKDETRKALPTQTELSETLGSHQATFSKRFDEIVDGLKAKINEQGFDPELRKRIKEAIESIPEKKERKAFDLDKTVGHIVGLFEKDRTRTALSTQVELSEALGPAQKTFFNHFDEILDGLKAKISERGFDPELRKRIENAIAHRAEVRQFLKRLAVAGALESAALWQDFPREEKPDILKIEVGKIPVRAIKVNLEQYAPMSEIRAPPLAAKSVIRSEVRSTSKIPTATEIYQTVIQTDEFLNSLTLEQALAESEKIDRLLDQEQSRIIPYIGHHLTDKGRAVQLVLEKVMDRLMNDPQLDSKKGHINFARISLYPATYKQIGGDTLANRFKELMLEAFNSGSYFAGASAYADGPQLVILDVPIRDFRKNYPKLWNRKLNQLIKEFPEIKGHRLLKSLRAKHYAAYSVIRLPGERHEVPPQELKIPVNEEKRRKKYTTEGKDRELIPILVEDEYAWDYRKWLRAKLKEARLNLKNEREKRAEFEKRGRKALAEKTKERIKKAYEQVGYFAQRVTLAADMESVARVEAVEKMPDALKRKLGVSQWLLTATNIKKVRGYLREKNDFKMLGEFYKAFILGRDRLVPPGEYPSGKIPRLRHMIHQLELEDSLYSIRNVQKAWREFLKIPNANEDHLRKFQSFYLKYQLTRNEMVIRADRDVRMPGMEIRTVDSGTVETVYTPRFVYKEAFLNGIYQAARNGSLGKLKRHLAATGQRPLSETISETLIIGKRSIGDEFYGAVLVKSKDGKALRWLPFGGEYDGFNAWNKQYPPDKEDHMDEVFHRGVEFALRDERARRVANGRASLKEVLDFLQAWTDNMRKPGNASKLFVRTVKFYPPGKAEGGADFERPTLYKKRGSDIHIGPLFAKSNGGNYRHVDPLSWKVGDEVTQYEMPDRTEPVETLISATFTLDDEPLAEGENLMDRIPNFLEKWNDLQKKLKGSDGLSGQAATVKQVEKMARDRGLPLPAVKRSEVRTSSEAERFAAKAIKPDKPADRPKLTKELKDLVDKKLTLNGPFGTENVLSAEDEVVVQQSLKYAFLDAGLGTLEIVPHGTAALEVLKSQEIKLLLTDVNMAGGKNGDELIFELRKNLNSNIPVIVLSSDARASGLPKLFDNVIYISKPFSSIHIASLVKYLILKSQSTDVNEYDIWFKLESADDASAVFAQYKAARENDNQEEAQQLEALIYQFLALQNDPNVYREPGENEPNLYKSARWVKDQIMTYELERGEQAIPDEEIQRMLEVLNKAEEVLKWYEKQWRGFLKDGRNGKNASEATIHFDQLIDGFIEKASRPDYEGPRQEGRDSNLFLAARYVKEEIQKIKIQSGYFLSNGILQLKVKRAEVRSTSPGDEAEKMPETLPLEEAQSAAEAAKAQIKKDRSTAVEEIRKHILSDSRMGALFEIGKHVKSGGDLKSRILNLVTEFGNGVYPAENFPHFFAEQFKFSDDIEAAKKIYQEIEQRLTFESVVKDFLKLETLKLPRRVIFEPSELWAIVRGYLINKDPEGSPEQKEARWKQARLSEAAAAIAKLDLVKSSKIDQAVADYVLRHLESKQVQTLIALDARILKGEPLEKILNSVVEDIIRNPPGLDSTDFQVNEGDVTERSEIRKIIRIDLNAIDLKVFFEGKEKEIETLITRGKGNVPSVDFYLRGEIKKEMGRGIGGTLGRVNTRILERFRRKSAEFSLEVIKESFEREGVGLAEEKIQRLQERIAFAAKRPEWFDQDTLSFVSANRIPNTNRIYSVDQALSQLLSEVMPKDQMNTLGSDIPELGLTPAEMGEALSPLADKVNRFYAVYEKVAIRQKDLPFTSLSFIKVSGDPAKKLSEIMEREASTGESPLLFAVVGGMDLSQLGDRFRKNVVELPVAKTDMPLILKQRAIRWGAELLMIRGELLKQNPDFLKPEVFKNYLVKYHPALAVLAQSFSVRNGFLRAEVGALVEQFTTKKLLSTQA